jgi:hypothetical protein
MVVALIIKAGWHIPVDSVPMGLVLVVVVNSYCGSIERHAVAIPDGALRRVLVDECDEPEPPR